MEGGGRRDGALCAVAQGKRTFLLRNGSEWRRNQLTRIVEAHAAGNARRPQTHCVHGRAPRPLPVRMSSSSGCEGRDLDKKQYVVQICGRKRPKVGKKNITLALHGRFRHPVAVLRDVRNWPRPALKMTLRSRREEIVKNVESTLNRKIDLRDLLGSRF